MIPMELLDVRVEMPANTPVVILREQTGAQRLLPIAIGSPEATAIHVAINGIESPRPLTHDLMAEVLDRLGAELQRIVVTEIRDHIFYAELHLETPAGEIVVSSRPSDAIALAVRTGSPIFATEPLLMAAGRTADELFGVEDDDEDDDEDGAVAVVDDEAIIDEFRDFLDDLDPDDFNG